MEDQEKAGNEKWPLNSEKRPPQNRILKVDEEAKFIQLGDKQAEAPFEA